MCTNDFYLPVSTPQVRSKDVTIVNQASVLMSNPISRVTFAVGMQNLCSRFLFLCFCFALVCRWSALVHCSKLAVSEISAKTEKNWNLVLIQKILRATISEVVFRIELQKYKGLPNNVLLCSLSTKGGWGGTLHIIVGSGC